MKNILLAFVTLFFSFNAFASGHNHCNSYKDKRRFDACYKQVITAQKERVAKHVKAIRASHKLSTEQLEAFNAEQREWEVQVNNGCVDDVVCVYESQVNRKNWLAQKRRTLGS